MPPPASMAADQEEPSQILSDYSPEINEEQTSQPRSVPEPTQSKPFPLKSIGYDILTTSSLPCR